MWGPLASLRRRMRPLPTVGWVFLLEWEYRSYSHALRMRWQKPKIRIAGKQRDLCVPIVDADAALAEAKRMIEHVLKPGAEIVAMREADRRDIPESWDCPRIGPRRHFGFTSPRDRKWDML
ncbi:hypothetical protein N9W17_03620 [Jannaschia sp.]|nr:hypothetical protein [Jannaschia sp.]